MGVGEKQKCFHMQLNSRSYQLKRDCYVLCKHESPWQSEYTYKKYTKENKKSIKTYHYKKKINGTQRKKVKKIRTKELHDRQKTTDKMVIVSLSLSIVTLNVNRLNLFF